MEQRVVDVGDDPVGKVKIQLLDVGRIGFSEEEGFQGSSKS